MDKLNEKFWNVFSSILASLLFMFLSWYWELLTLELAVAVGVPAIIIVVTIYITKSFSHIGITNWSKQRGSSKHFRNILSNAETKVDFLVSWGGSIPRLIPGKSGYWEKDLADMVNRGIQIRILLIQPGSEAETKRKQRRPEWVKGDIERTIEALLAIKNDRINPDKRVNFEIGLYSGEAIWAMCIVDNKLASIGFYGYGNGRDLPSLELRRIRNKQTFFDAFVNQYEAIWSGSQKVDSEDD
jgi:hypothetical protein